MGQSVWLAVSDLVNEMLLEEESDIEAERLALSVSVAAPLLLSEGLGERDPERVPKDEAETVGDVEVVPEIDPVAESVVVWDGVGEKDGLEEREKEATADGVSDGDALPDTLKLKLPVVLPVLLRVSDAVPESEAVGESVQNLEGETDADAVLVTVLPSDVDGVGLGVTVGVVMMTTVPAAPGPPTYVSPLVQQPKGNGRLRVPPAALINSCGSTKGAEIAMRPPPPLEPSTPRMPFPPVAVMAPAPMMPTLARIQTLPPLPAPPELATYHPAAPDALKMSTPLEETAVPGRRKIDLLALR